MHKLFSSLSVIVGVTALIVTVNGRSASSSKPKPVLIHALYPQVVHESRASLDKFASASNGEGRSRQYYQMPDGNSQRSPERGQILHRPNKNRERSHTNEYPNSRPNMPQMSEGGPPPQVPMVLNSKGKAKNVKYIPTGGFQQQQQGNSNNRAPPPQVYVISAGGGDEEEDDQGMMGSVQTYFKSIPRRIKEAVQGFMGTVD